MWGACGLLCLAGTEFTTRRAQVVFDALLAVTGAALIVVAAWPPRWPRWHWPVLIAVAGLTLAIVELRAALP